MKDAPAKAAEGKPYRAETMVLLILATTSFVFCGIGMDAAHFRFSTGHGGLTHAKITMWDTETCIGGNCTNVKHDADGVCKDLKNAMWGAAAFGVIGTVVLGCTVLVCLLDIFKVADTCVAAHGMSALAWIFLCLVWAIDCGVFNYELCDAPLNLKKLRWRYASGFGLFIASWGLLTPTIISLVALITGKKK